MLLVTTDTLNYSVTRSFCTMLGPYCCVYTKDVQGRQAVRDENHYDYCILLALLSEALW